MTKKILIVDDDQQTGDMLQEVLEKAQYLPLRAYSGTEALLILKNETPDLILLDLMLPGLSGEETLPQIKDIPVIVLSAKADVADKVSLLKCGAVDYITKPFDTKELLARIEVQLRLKNNMPNASTLSIAHTRLDCVSHSATVFGKEVHLTKTEFAILKLLMQNPNRAISRSAILDKISFDTPDCTERSLKQHISNLRKKLTDSGEDDIIQAVWGIGFIIKEE